MEIVAMALDQSPNNTGWAVGKPMDPKPLYGKFELSPWGNDEPLRILTYKRWLDGMLQRFAITHLFYEQPVAAMGLGKAQIYVPTRGANAGTTRARVVNQKDPRITDNQASVKTLIWLCAAERGIPVHPIDVNHMRQHAIGCKSIVGLHGDAHTKELKKRALAACSKAGLVVDDHNVAEAIWHLDFGLSTIDAGHAQQSLVRSRRAELGIWFGKET